MYRLVPGPCEPEDLIDGIIFAANYLGCTQVLSDKNPSKSVRMSQAHEAVSHIKVISIHADSQWCLLIWFVGVSNEPIRSAFISLFKQEGVSFGNKTPFRGTEQIEIVFQSFIVKFETLVLVRT